MIDYNQPRFVKSSWSGGDGGNCVEWATTTDGVHVRDSKSRTGTVLRFTNAEWTDLTAAVAANTAHAAVSHSSHGVYLRHHGDQLVFTHGEWAAFAAAAKAGECQPAVSPNVSADPASVGR